MIEMDVGTVLLIVVGVVLLIALIALLGGGMVMGGMAMMAGIIGNASGVDFVNHCWPDRFDRTHGVIRRLNRPSEAYPGS